MNYFRANKYVKLFEEFKILTHEYWSKLPEQHSDYMDMPIKYEETNESFAIRAQIARLLPHIEEAASTLGISYIMKSYPPPAVGGVVVPVNVYESVIKPQIGWAVLDRKTIIDTLIQSISVAEAARRNALIHMLLPWNWIIDLCAFVIRVPFIILRRAGLPSQVEDNIISHALKIIAIIILISWLAYKGVSLAGVDVSSLVKNIMK